MNASAVDFYQDSRGEWRWRRKAGNGKIVGASSEGYVHRRDAEANAGRDGSKDKWEFYKDKRGEFRWRALSAANGKQVGRSSESYKARRDCEDNARLNGWKG